MNLVRAGLGALFVTNAALAVALSLTTACAPRPNAHGASNAAPSASATTSASPPASASAAATPTPAVDATPSSATLVVNVRAAKQPPLSFVLQSDIFRVAHMVARLNLDKDVDWLAFSHTPTREEHDVLVVHHHVDPDEMAQVLDLEGSRESASPNAPHVWAPRGAPRGYLIVELDPSTLAFGFRRGLARKDDVARLRSMGELSAAPIHVMLIHRPLATADAGAKRNATLRLELARADDATLAVSLTTDVEDTATVDEFADVVSSTLAEYGLGLRKKKDGTVLDHMHPTKAEHTWGFRGTIPSDQVADALGTLAR